MRRIIIASILSILTLLLSLQAKAQVMMSGTVVEKGSKAAVADANIIFQNPKGKRTYGFASTDVQGKYHFECQTDSDSLLVTVTGFNLKKHSRVVAAASDRIDFIVEYHPLHINEVVFKSEPVKRKADTVIYYVNSYLDSLVDRSIGDVLKKMPGIDVSGSGQISYNNQPINRFYIEGLDMMGGRYGVAVNNVRAEDIASVEVLENHQPIKALKGFEYSPDAAINLRLKSKAKGSLIANVLLGAGWLPWLWNGELAMMYFTGKWQTMMTYKTNNSGEDVTSELESLYDNFTKEGSELAVHTPSTPDTDRERYMNNSTHALSVSNIFKLDKESDNTLNVNAMYLHDRQKYNAASLTTYYLPDTEVLEVNETTAATESTDEAEVKVKYNLNKAKLYLNEQIAFGMKWDDNSGDVLNGTERVDQFFTMRQMRLQNNLGFTKVFGDDIRLSFNSRINAADLPSDLRVTPVLYPELFGYESQEAIQEMSNRKFRSSNTVSIIKPFTKVGIDLQASVGFSNDLQTMKSNLYNPFSIGNVPDSLCNHITYQRYDLRGKLAMSYRYREFHMSIGTSPTYSHLTTDDHIQNRIRSKDRVFFNPYINIDWKISPNLSVLANGGITGNLGSGSNVYSGYIMTDYRQVGSRDGDIAESMEQNYTGEVRYADALKSIFSSVRIGYWRRNSNMMYGTQYTGSLSRIQAYEIDNLSDGWEVSGKIEKRFNGLSTTVGIPLGISQSNMEVLRQGQVMNTRTRDIPLGLEISSRLNANIFLDYYSRYVRSSSEIENSKETLSPINALHQELGLSFIFFRKLSLNIDGEHYFNDAIYSGSRNIFFLDAALKYKARKIEYILEGRNLLNTWTYNHSSYNDITSYKYSYTLRPVSVMFKIRFSLGA